MVSTDVAQYKAAFRNSCWASKSASTTEALRRSEEPAEEAALALLSSYAE